VDADEIARRVDGAAVRMYGMKTLKDAGKCDWQGFLHVIAARICQGNHFRDALTVVVNVGFAALITPVVLPMS